jgi:peptide/nickel transport system substrate-binding protein
MKPTLLMPAMVTRRNVLLGGGIAAAAALAGPSLLRSAQASEGATPKRGGTFRVGAEDASSKDNMDPALAFSGFAAMMCRAMYDSLVKEDATGKPYDSLAEAFEPDATAQVWTIRIRDGVTFHDGKAMTIDDVIFSITRAMTTTGSLAARSLESLDPKGIEKDGKLTARLRLKHPNSFFKQAFFHPCLSIVPSDFDAKKPVGSGPFKFVSFEDQKFVAERNPNYWLDGKPYLDRIEVIGFADPTTARLNALMSGQIDAMPNVAFTQARTIEAREDIKLLSAAGASFEPFTMRVDQPPFNDPRVLEAFKLMVDREQLVRNVYAGRGRIGNDLGWAQDPYYNAGIPQRAYDPDKAKFLLKEAGQENLVIDLHPSPEAPWNSAAAQVLAQQAKKVGVTVNLVASADLSSFYDQKYLKVEFSQDMFGPNPLSVAAGYSLLPDSPYNESHWKDEKAAELFKLASSTGDADKTRQYLNDFQQLVHDKAGWIVWGFRDSLQAVSSRFGGLEPSLRGVNMHDLSGVWAL